MIYYLGDEGMGHFVEYYSEIAHIICLLYSKLEFYFKQNQIFFKNLS